MQMRLKNKVAIVTGAGEGIGRATALLFASEGAKVVVAEVNVETGPATVQQINEAGAEATFVRVDVASAVDIERMVRAAIDAYGRLDILVNNAGIDGDVWENTTEGNWRRVIDVNLTGVFLGCKYAEPEMKKHGGGSIVNVSSMAGLQATSRSPSYTVSKAGVVLLSRFLGRALGKDKIRVNCVCPGPVDTAPTRKLPERLAALIPRVPMGRIAQPEEIASVILFFASDESSFVTGAALPIDGGITA